MERATEISQIIDTTSDSAKYDRAAKNLLSFKAIDAWILKACVREFEHYSVEYIADYCLTGEIEIAEHAVHQDHLDKGGRMSGDERVIRLNSESSSINEGTVYYDVRFNAVVPSTDEKVTLIINLEIQTDDKPGYDLVTRGMYYCARMISEQHGTVFTGSHYEKIQKVYSIWICPSTAEARRNGMYRYHTIETPVIGKPYVKEESYDKSEVIILNLGSAGDAVECDIINLLNVYFSDSVGSDEKKKILREKYNIAMTKEMDEEVQNMCNLSSAIERKGIAEGIAKGIAKGRSEGVDIGKFETTAMYYRKGRISAEEAACDLKMTLEEFKEKACLREESN